MTPAVAAALALALAAREPAFKRRLEEASERTRALRAGHRATPITDPLALDQALRREAAEALATEIASRL